MVSKDVRLVPFVPHNLDGEIGEQHKRQYSKMSQMVMTQFCLTSLIRQKCILHSLPNVLFWGAEATCIREAQRRSCRLHRGAPS